MGIVGQIVRVLSVVRRHKKIPIKSALVRPTLHDRENPAIDLGCPLWMVANCRQRTNVTNVHCVPRSLGGES